MKDEEYFSLDRFSHSAMKKFEQSPLHYLNEKRTPQEETPALVLGSAFHCLVLEPERFEEAYAVAPHLDRRTSVGKSTWEAFCMASSGKKIISDEMYAKVGKMRDALYNNPPAKELMDQITETEKAILWEQRETGVPCKGKIDGIGEVIIDLKSCQDARQEFFHKAIINDYKRQPAMYVDAAKANKLGSKDFYFIAVEKEAPFGVSVHKVARDLMDYGRQSIYSICQDFAYWKEMGSPEVGYEWRAPLGYFTVNVPYWMK